jgi:choline dehydrogenase-like flavoprotein
VILDARGVEQGTNVDADICVVGAGAAGITLARELADRPLRVVVLESGGFTYDPVTQSLYEGERAGVPYFPLETARLRFFGGTTNHWGGLCRPFDGADFERRPWIPHSGWPIRKAELDPFYARAADVLNLAPEFGLAYWRDRSPRPPLPLARSALTRTAQIVPDGSLRLGATYRGDLERARNVTTYLHANVTELDTDEAGTTVSRVRVARLDGGAFSVSAGLFVLAAGGIENARLLLASDRRHGGGLGNGHDLVGRFFLEHPRFRAATFVPSDPQLPVGFYAPHGADGAQIQGYLALSDEVQRAEEVVDVQIRMEPEYVEPFERALESPDVRSFERLARGAPLDEFGRHVARVASDVTTWRRFGVPAAPLPVPHPDVVSALAHSTRVDRTSLIPALLGDIAGVGYARALGDAPVESLALVTRIESAPNPDSRVTLVRERDALGMRRVRLDWRLSEIDRRSAVRTVELLGAELGRGGLGRLRLDGGWHHMGTTRMADDPKLGVADRDCRVHGVSNLFVAGSSVFPTAGSGTPTLTLVALALRLADHLRGRLA